MKQEEKIQWCISQHTETNHWYDAVNIYKQDGSVSKGYPESNILVENDSILVIRK
jgi:hypothetical protein